MGKRCDKACAHTCEVRGVRGGDAVFVHHIELKAVFIQSVCIGLRTF